MDLDTRTEAARNVLSRDSTLFYAHGTNGIAFDYACNLGGLLLPGGTLRSLRIPVLTGESAGLTNLGKTYVSAIDLSQFNNWSKNQDYMDRAIKYARCAAGDNLAVRPTTIDRHMDMFFAAKESIRKGEVSKRNVWFSDYVGAIDARIAELGALKLIFRRNPKFAERVERLSRIPVVAVGRSSSGYAIGAKSDVPGEKWLKAMRVHIAATEDDSIEAIDEIVQEHKNTEMYVIPISRLGELHDHYMEKIKSS